MRIPSPAESAKLMMSTRSMPCINIWPRDRGHIYVTSCMALPKFRCAGKEIFWLTLWADTALHER